MTKVDRMLVAYGDHFEIECAVRTDLSSPVKTFLEDMETGGWQPEAEVQLEKDEQRLLEPDEQIYCYDWFVKACLHLAKTGQPIHRTSYNQLQNGIWEIKHYKLRISFYDTDGSGEYVPYVDTDSYKGTFGIRPWPEEFDKFLRLTTAFPKSQQDNHILKSQEVREEDLEHDRK